MAPRKKDMESRTPRVAGETVVGLFADQPAAERGIQALKAAGFTESQIGVAVRDRAQQKEITEGTGTQASEGAAAGAVGGGMVGGVIGLLAGVGALVIPGVGPIIAAGALASTLTGAGIGAAAGGLIGALAGMGVPDEDAKHFERGFQEGGVLVTVEAGGDAARARQALVLGDADLGPAHATMGTSGSAASHGADRLELREEQLDVDTERVQAGEVRLRKEVVTEQRTIDVPVTREEVVIERHDASARPAGEGAIGDEEDIRIPLMEEEVRVEKTPVVREEITARKRQVQDTERVSEKVRREEARIESQGDARISATGGAGESWRGNERRYRDDAAYAGPERRLATR
jgi:uncharacterized protein (TIGR02271 family)